MNQIDFLNIVSKAFINATNEVLDLYHEQPTRTTLTDHLSIVLLKIYQNFMLDLMPSSQMLVDKHNFYSFSILCRSSLDIIIQIKWILSLKGMEQDNVINIFLNFEGVGIGKNGKDFYEWQKQINPKYSTRQIALDLAIDQKSIILPLTEHSKYQELRLTVFDYLSKITHWNPRLIKEVLTHGETKIASFPAGYICCSVTPINAPIYSVDWANDVGPFAEIHVTTVGDSNSRPQDGYTGLYTWVHPKINRPSSYRKVAFDLEANPFFSICHNVESGITKSSLKEEVARADKAKVDSLRTQIHAHRDELGPREAAFTFFGPGINPKETAVMQCSLLEDDFLIGEFLRQGR